MQQIDRICRKYKHQQPKVAEEKARNKKRGEEKEKAEKESSGAKDGLCMYTCARVARARTEGAGDSIVLSPRKAYIAPQYE